MLRWLQPAAALLAVVAMFLPALRLDPPHTPPRAWSAAALIPAGWDALAQRPDAFQAAAGRFNRIHEILAYEPAGVYSVNGIFRLAPYLPVPLLPAAAATALMLLLWAARRPRPAALAAAVGTMSALFALLSSLALAVVAHKQAMQLQVLGGAAHDSLHLQAGLFLLPIALLAFALAPAPKSPAGPLQAGRSRSM